MHSLHTSFRCGANFSVGHLIHSCRSIQRARLEHRADKPEFWWGFCEAKKIQSHRELMTAKWFLASNVRHSVWAVNGISLPDVVMTCPCSRLCFVSHSIRHFVTVSFAFNDACELRRIFRSKYRNTKRGTVSSPTWHQTRNRVNVICVVGNTVTWQHLSQSASIIHNRGIHFLPFLSQINVVQFSENKMFEALIFYYFQMKTAKPGFSNPLFLKHRSFSRY